jgi:FkbM family methyltransferase
MSVLHKIIRNIEKGTLFKNGWKALNNRLIKFIKFNNFIVFADSYRQIHRRIQHQIPKLNHNHIPLGNYFLDKRKDLNSNSIIYSLGVGTHIDFDIAISEKYGCPVFMYDPTPASIEFMKTRVNDKLKFFPYGVWNEPSELKFYTPDWGGSSTIFPQYESQVPEFVAPCDSLSVFMKQNQHNHIDVLKMDIEGAGIVVLRDILKRSIFPNQIVVELERPIERDPTVQIRFFADVLDIMDTLKSQGYEIFQIPQSGYKYLSFELLCVKTKYK